MKNKTKCAIKVFVLLLLLAVWGILNFVYLRPPIYYDVSAWLSWIWFLFFLILGLVFSFFRNLYWYFALILTVFGALMTVLFDGDVEKIAVKVINFSFIVWIAAAILQFVKFAKNK